MRLLWEVEFDGVEVEAVGWLRDYYALVLFLFKQLFVVFFEGLAFESQSDVRLLMAFHLLLQHESSYFLILEFVVEILGKRTFYFLVLFFQ